MHIFTTYNKLFGHTSFENYPIVLISFVLFYYGYDLYHPVNKLKNIYLSWETNNQIKFMIYTLFWLFMFSSYQNE